MRSVEWNKKEDLVAEQALRHLKVCHYLTFEVNCKILYECLLFFFANLFSFSLIYRVMRH